MPAGNTGPAGSPLPRLRLRLAAGLIEVATNDAALAARLAQLGLDRLVLPLSLHALEDLLAVAG